MRLISAFIPIWCLAAAGYGARRQRLLGDDAASVLGRFVFHLAMPAALFTTMAATPVSRFSLPPLLAFAGSAVAVIALSWLLISRWFGRRPGERPIWAMAAGYVNSANLGIPVAQQILGSVSFLAEVILVQNLLITPAILIALDRHHAEDGRIHLRRIATLPLRNPVILASLLGVVWSATKLPVPGTARTTLGLLAAAAVPAGLVALGASLHVTRPEVAQPPEDAPPESAPPESAPSEGAPPGGRGDPAVGSTRGELAAVTALKLLGQPLLALGAGWALGLSRPELLAVVVCAGLPTAQNTFIFAQEYDTGEALASRSVALTTALSLATLAAAAALLGR